MEKNYSDWDEIDAACEELVDFMIQQSEKPMKYDPTGCGEPEQYSVPTDIIMPIACDIRDFLVELLERDYGCYYPPLVV